jgi:hypothetical protein
MSYGGTPFGRSSIKRPSKLPRKTPSGEAGPPRSPGAPYNRMCTHLKCWNLRWIKGLHICMNMNAYVCVTLWMLLLGLDHHHLTTLTYGQVIWWLVGRSCNSCAAKKKCATSKTILREFKTVGFNHDWWLLGGWLAGRMGNSIVGGGCHAERLRSWKDHNCCRTADLPMRNPEKPTTLYHQYIREPLNAQHKSRWTSKKQKQLHTSSYIQSDVLMKSWR